MREKLRELTRKGKNNAKIRENWGNVSAGVLILLMAFGAVFGVFAQTNDATPSGSVSPTAVSTVTDKEVQDLKEKIASKVAELNKNKKAIVGTVTDIGDNSFKIKNENDKEYSAKIDPELTKIYSISESGKKEIKFADITEASYAVISGVLLDNNINANFIYFDKPVLVKSGKITEVNKDDFSFEVTTVDKDNYTLIVENFTKQEILNIKSLEIERTGFSKIKEGDTIHFVSSQNLNEKDKNNLTALRYLIIPQEYFIK